MDQDGLITMIPSVKPKDKPVAVIPILSEPLREERATADIGSGSIVNRTSPTTTERNGTASAVMQQSDLTR